jgi:hypothetical protein
MATRKAIGATRNAPAKRLRALPNRRGGRQVTSPTEGSPKFASAEGITAERPDARSQVWGFCSNAPVCVENEFQIGMNLESAEGHNLERE